MKMKGKAYKGMMRPSLETMSGKEPHEDEYAVRNAVDNAQRHADNIRNPKMKAAMVKEARARIVALQDITKAGK